MTNIHPSVAAQHKAGNITHKPAAAGSVPANSFAGYDPDAIAKLGTLQAQSQKILENSLQRALTQPWRKYASFGNLHKAAAAVHAEYGKALNEAYEGQKSIATEFQKALDAKNLDIQVKDEALSRARTEANGHKGAAAKLETAEADLKKTKAELETEKANKGGLGLLGVSGISAATALVCMLAVYLTMEHRDKKLIKNNSTLKVQLQQAQQSLQAQQQAASSSGGYGSDPTNGMFGS